MDERLARLKLLTLEEAQAVYFYVRDGRSLNANRAAEIIGVSRNTFYRRWDSARQKLNIPDKGYEPGHYLIYAKYLAKWPSNINWLDDFIASETNETVTQPSSTPSETVGTTIPAQESQSPDKPVGKGVSMLNIDTLRVRIRRIAQITIALVIAVGLIYLISTLITRETQTLSLEASVTPGETPEETVVVTPASTNTPTEASKSMILFEDNFDNGISPDWRDEDGNPFTGNDPYTVDGKLTTKNGFIARFGDETWKNYKIQFTVYDWVCSSYRNISVGVRAKDKNNMLALFGMACHQDWNEVINGKWTPIPHAQVAGGNTPYKYELIVTGDDYQLVGSPNLNYKGYPNGMIYLFMTPGRVIDDFKITQLP